MKRKFFLNLVSKRSFHGEDIAEVAVEKRNFLKSSSPCGTPQLLLELIKTFFYFIFSYFYYNKPNSTTEKLLNPVCKQASY